ncbi:MAG TPA: Calx-beta domain-containing protein [Pyrinomonadaceae bacterium]
MLRLKRILFVLLTATSLFFLMWQNARTQSPLRLITSTSKEAININPSISGDGRMVAFESTADIAGAGGSESFRAIVANVSSDPPTWFQMGATRASFPALSQDGSRIAFASKDNPLGTNNDGNSEIFLYDGARLIQVTNTSPGDIADRVVNGNFLSSISDDGRFIAFSSNRDLVNQNADGNLEIFVFDTITLRFTQLTNTSGITGCSDAKISGNGASVAYIRDTGATPGGARDLLLQSRTGPSPVRVLATDVPSLAMTYGRAISDDGLRVVYAMESETGSSQVFLFDGRNDITRQVTSLGVRAADVALNATISGDGSRIAFSTRRLVIPPTSDAGVDLYTFDIPTATFARVTSGPSTATAEVVSSLNDDGSLVAFNFPRVLSGPVADSDFSNNSEIYLTGTAARPAFGSLAIFNGASFGHEPSSTKAVASDSIAVARGSALANTTEQSRRLPDGTFPFTLGGTKVTVNGRPAQIFFVSPTEVDFHLPPATEIGTAEVVVTNGDGFPSHGAIPTLPAAPGIFTFTGDGLGEGVILNADTLTRGPFDPGNGDLRLIVFATGVFHGSQISVTAGGRALTVGSVLASPEMPGMDEVHVLVPSDLRGAGTVDLVVRAGARDSNSVAVEFAGDSSRDIVINEFLADPPDGASGDANHDGVRNSSDDEFIELLNNKANGFDIDLSGYQILTRAGSETNDTVRHTFAPGTILPACTAIVVFGGGNLTENNSAFGDSQVLKSSSGSLSLINSGGVITIRDPAGTIANFLSYGGSTGLNADVNQSLTRSPDITGNFILHGFAGSQLFSPGTKLNGAGFAFCGPAAYIDVSPSSASIGLNVHQQFIASAYDAGGNEVSGVIFSWQSSNPSAAMIDQNGRATGISAGLTEIRASGRGVQSAPATLTVNPPAPILTSVTISPAAAIVGVGDTQQFTAQAKDQFGRDIDQGTINFVSSNTTVATVDFQLVTPATGSGRATVTARASGSAQIIATANSGGTTVASHAAPLTVEPGAGQVLISEFRTRGANGAADEFMEIYNPTTSPVTIGGLKIRASNNSGAASDRITVPVGTTLGSGCHYLLANNSTGGYNGSVAADQTYTTGIADDGGIAITRSDGTTIIDAVGMGSGSIYKEGTTLPSLGNNINQSYERKTGAAFGNGTDTNNNSKDFFLNSGSSNPQNSASGCLDLTTADLAITNSDSPDPAITGSEVTYTISVTNNGAAIAESALVTDTLPVTVTYISCSATEGGVCGGANNNRTITFPSLAAGASAIVTLVAIVNSAAGTTITNTATVASRISDPNLVNNSATAITLVQAPPPALTINDISLNEGDNGTTIFTFFVSLSRTAPAVGVTFDIATADGLATVANTDYITRHLTGQTIPAGQQTYAFEVTVNGDTLVEPNETFFVNVTNVSGATVGEAQGLGTIQNDDTAHLVISQLYGGGGNSGATFRNDFIEIFNRGATTADLAGWSLQYNTASDTDAWSVTPLCLTGSCPLAPGKYFLVQEASGSGGTQNLPLPNATGTITMAATTGKVALVSSTASLSGACPVTASIVDVIGYGGTAATANFCFEGIGPASAPSATSADLRKSGGCADTNNNAADFFVHAPIPRNTSSPTNNCVSSTTPNLTIDDVTIAEGNSGTVTASFTVSLSVPAPSTDVTFDIATQNHTATTASNDYVAKTLTGQIIPAGQQRYTFDVTVNGDTAVEFDETFFVNVTNVTGATIADAQGAGIIRNDDLPALSVNDVALKEGNHGATTFTFTTTLSAPAPTGGVTFDIKTQDNTATVADSDYLATNVTAQTIPAGSQTSTFDVTVNGDLNVEANETFFVNVMNVTGAIVTDGRAVGTIQNDDSPLLSINDVTMNEGNNGTTIFTFTVTSSSPAPAGGITFDIGPQDHTAIAAGNDYVARSLTGQTILAGSNKYLFEVTVNGDTLVEPNETFLVNVTNVSNAEVADGQGQGTIQNDDTALMVISQLYGGGGNSGAVYKNDFVELFNRGTTTVDLAGWSVQYSSATSSTWAVTPLCSSGPCLVLPGHYFLVQEDQGAGGFTNLPTPNAAGTIAMTAGSGKVALNSSTIALSGTCPSATSIHDLVGYGGTASCFEGIGPAPAPGSNTADFRRSGGCIDRNENAIDFAISGPNPRNSSSQINDCSTGFRPDITINDVALTESDSGTKTVDFTITLSATSAQSVAVDYSTADGTATQSSDYQSTGSTLIFNPGDLMKTITVTINGDTTDESNETFFVNLSNASNGVILDPQGQATITDNDPPPSLSISDASVLEGDSGTTTATFTVTLSAVSGLTVTANHATADNSAIAGSDYESTGGTLTFSPGDTSKTITVAVNGDTAFEANETFFVNLSSPTNATIADNQGQGTIRNDDAAPPSANLSITQTDSPNPVASGDNVTYALTVTNNGPDPAPSVIVTDSLPSTLTFVSCSATGGGVCGGAGNNRTVTFSSIANGTSAVVALVATVNSSVSGGTAITNVATVASATLDTDNSDNSASQTTSINSIIINEALVSFASGAGRAKFLELYNTTNQPRDISGMVISFRPGGSGNTPSVITLPGAAGSNTTVVGAHGYFLVVNGASTFGVNAGYNPGAGNLDLNGTGGGIKIELNGARLDGLTYQGSATAINATFAAYREGSVFTFTATTTSDLVRTSTSIDTNKNLTDFRLLSSTATVTPKAKNPP